MSIISEEEKKSIKLLKNEIETIKIKMPRNFLPTYSFFKLIEDTTAVQCLINLVDKLTEKVKELEKGNRSLMDSRKKWEDRYYKQKHEIEELREQNTRLLNYLNDSYYVSADKIREKIKELEEKAKQEKTITFYCNSNDIARTVITNLNELLEENTNE